MPRLPRVVLVDVPHHVTQRGNNRQAIFTTDADRATYLDLLQQYSQLYELSLLGYCLMSNHVHLVAVPRTPAGLSQALKQAHGRYASYWNARQASSGHVWQGRFYSCPLDESHLWAALRYVELNPVRAGIVASATEWRRVARPSDSVFPSHIDTVDTVGAPSLRFLQGRVRCCRYHERLCLRAYIASTARITCTLSPSPVITACHCSIPPAHETASSPFSSKPENATVS